MGKGFNYDQGFPAYAPERRNPMTPKHELTLIDNPTQAYIELKRTAKERGLFDPQPGYYALRIALVVAMYVLSAALLVWLDSFALQLLLAAPLLAFAYTQIAFIAHNSGHRQIWRSGRQDDWLTVLFMGLFLGVSGSWWVDKHNEHHGNPNVLDMDPDIDFPMIAFTEEQAASKQGWARFVVRYQAFFYPFLILFITYNMRVHSVLKIARGEARYPLAEAAMMGLHFLLYFGLLLSQMSLLQSLLFFFVHHALVGVYLASVFAANHKGMPILEKENELDFMTLQIYTSRNVAAHPLTDFLYGGLNYQIEHHLFPTMAENKLREARSLLLAFCAEQGLPYYETSFVQAQKEILLHLHEVSAALRQPVTA